MVVCTRLTTIVGEGSKTCSVTVMLPARKGLLVMSAQEKILLRSELIYDTRQDCFQPSDYYTVVSPSVTGLNTFCEGTRGGSLTCPCSDASDTRTVWYNRNRELVGSV